MTENETFHQSLSENNTVVIKEILKRTEEPNKFSHYFQAAYEAKNLSVCKLVYNSYIDFETKHGSFDIQLRYHMLSHLVSYAILIAKKDFSDEVFKWTEDNLLTLKYNNHDYTSDFYNTLVRNLTFFSDSNQEKKEFLSVYFNDMKMHSIYVNMDYSKKLNLIMLNKYLSKNYIENNYSKNNLLIHDLKNNNNLFFSGETLKLICYYDRDNLLTYIKETKNKNNVSNMEKILSIGVVSSYLFKINERKIRDDFLKSIYNSSIINISDFSIKDLQDKYVNGYGGNALINEYFSEVNNKNTHDEVMGNYAFKIDGIFVDSFKVSYPSSGNINMGQFINIEEEIVSSRNIANTPKIFSSKEVEEKNKIFKINAERANIQNNLISNHNEINDNFKLKRI